jgi:hypothetical protein
MLDRMGTVHELRHSSPLADEGSSAPLARSAQPSQAGPWHPGATASFKDTDDRGADVAFGFVLFVLWAFSFARVIVALSDREVFGAEASLAFVCSVALPACVFGGWARGRARRRPSSLPDRQAAVVVAFRTRD